MKRVVATSGHPIDLSGASLQAPDQIVVFRPGQVRTTKYEPFEVDPEQVIANFETLGRDLPIDFDHATHVPEMRTRDGEAPAAGWITSLTWQPGVGLVASVDWLERGRARVEAREYRYFSPTGEVVDGKFVDLWSLALTNDPATLDIEPLVASRYAGLTPRKQRGRVSLGGSPMLSELLRLLGLPEDADLAAMQAAITDENRGAVASLLGLEPGASSEEILAKIGSMLNLNPEADPTPEPPEMTAEMEEAVMARVVTKLGRALGLPGETRTEAQFVAAAKNAIANPKGHVPASEIATLRRDIDVLKLANERLEFKAHLATDDVRGRIPPAKEEAFFTLYRTDRATFDDVVKSMRPVAGPGSSSQFDRDDVPARDAGKHQFIVASEKLAKDEKIPLRVAMSRIVNEQPNLYRSFQEQSG